MNIMDVLKIQHKVILAQLDYLEKLRNAEKETKPCCLKSVLRTIVETVHHHSRIEEKYLFPAMEPHMGKQMSSTAVMKFEHSEILNILATLKKTDSQQAVSLEAAKFSVFLKDHIKKEEKVLFPTAMKVLGEKNLKSLLQKSRIFHN